MSLRLAIGILLIIAISLAFFKFLMSPPSNELGLMALFLGITAAVSALIGYIAYRFGWIDLSPTLRWTLLGGYVLASVLTFFNVWFSAKLMFASQHDLLLAIVLLVFAGGIAMILGYFLSSTVTERVNLLKSAAEKLAQGELDTRVPVSGRDEVSSLSQTFNQMAEQLQAADQKQRGRAQPADVEAEARAGRPQPGGKHFGEVDGVAGVHAGGKEGHHGQQGRGLPER